MAKWENDYGEQFESEEAARENVYENMDIDDYAEYLERHVSYTSLLQWALKQPNFFPDFENEFCQAEDDYFRAYYYEVEDEEENDD